MSHEVILKHILQADFGFIYYPPNKANDHCIPTKVYEYLAASLPYITTEINSFQDLTTMYHSGMFLDFNRPNYVHLLQQLYDFKSIKNEPKTGIYWEEEKENLLDLLDIK